MAVGKINLESLGGGAALKETTPSDHGGKAPTKSKEIRNMPMDYFTRHQALRDQGKTSLLFTAFIIEAVRKALEEHEQQ